MSAQTFYIIDADGCIYNVDQYYPRLFACLYKNRKFLQKYADKTELTPEDQADIDTQLQKILADENNFTLSKEDENELDILWEMTKLGKIANLKKDNTYEYHVKKINEKSRYEILRFIKLENIERLRKLDKNSLILRKIFIDSNAQLIAKISSDKNNEIILMSGSNRQSYKLNKFGIDQNVTGCYFTDLNYFKDYLSKLFPQKKIILEKFTVTDIYNDLQVGSNYRQILQNNRSENDCWYDHTKLSLVYAATHRLASFHPSLSSTAYFIDDKKNILDALYKKLSLYPQLLPENITLQLERYNGEFHHGEYLPIKGKGPIDYNFYKNTKKMYEMCPGDADATFDATSTLNIEEFLKVRDLKKRGIARL